MKLDRLNFDFDNRKISFKKREYDFSAFFSDFRKIRLASGRISSSDLAVISVSIEMFDAWCREKMFLFNASKNSFIDVKLVRDGSLNGEEACTTSYVKDAISMEENDELYLFKYESPKFTKFITQRIDNIRESNLAVSKDTYDSLQALPFSLFEVYNDLTKENLIIKKTHILFDPSLKDNEIRLNRKQRICLGLEIPKFISQERDMLLKQALPADSDDFSFINSVYETNDRILKTPLSYQEKLRIKKIIGEHCGGCLKIIPVFESIAKINRKGMVQRLSDFYVGKSTISLIAKRPYEIDEGTDIVRVSRANMNLLGIDEMDKVRLQYKGQKISCRVLELDDNESFLETNQPCSLDLAVGIPVHIRKRLGIVDLATAIKIDRDTSFIFKKSLNEQIVPVLLTLFSTNLLTDSSIVWSALLSALAIPFVLYVNLSSKRNSRA